MEKLIIGANSLTGEEIGKALGDAIGANTVLKELDLSSAQAKYDSEKCDTAFVKGFSAGLGTNGALTSLNISINDLGGYWNSSGTEWISDMSGFEALAAAIPECK